MILQTAGNEFALVPYLLGLFSTLLTTGFGAYVVYRFQKKTKNEEVKHQREETDNQRKKRAQEVRNTLRNEIDQGRPTAFEIEEDDGTTREVTFKHFAEEIQEIGLNEALSLLQFIHIPTELYELHRDNLGFLEEDEQEAVIEYYTRVRAYQNQLEPLELGHYAQLVDILEKTSREETPDFLPMLESRINDCARGAYEQLGSVHESGDRAMEVLDGNREKHESDERADPDKEKV